MVTVHLDKHDLLYHIEGFAIGSHLRQHIWREVVEKYIPQMSEEEIDFLWYYLRRDVWPNFFNRDIPKLGAEDFLHCMAALHKNNYFYVKVKYDNEIVITKTAYLFQNRFYDPYDFRFFYSNERIIIEERIDGDPNENVPKQHQHWWNNTDIYNLSVEQVTKLENENNKI